MSVPLLLLYRSGWRSFAITRAQMRPCFAEVLFNGVRIDGRLEGNLLDREAVDVVQYENFPLIRCQSGQRRFEVLLINLGCAVVDPQIPVGGDRGLELAFCDPDIEGLVVDAAPDLRPTL